MKSALYLSAKNQARERQLLAMAYKALCVCSPSLQQRAAKESLPLQRGACRLVSTLQLQQRKCLMNSMGAIKMAAVEEGLRREWQERTEKDRKEVKQMKKDLEERWLQVHQRELRGIEKERELSKEARVAKVAISPMKAKAKKSRNELVMTGAHHVSAPPVAKDPLSSGEPEADAMPHFRRDEGSMDEPDSGLKGSPLPRELYV